MNRKGKVYLIGSGPGDEGLITLKGVECLKISDVIIYDYLSNKQLLKHCHVDSEKIFAGKMSSCHVLSQDDINKLLIKKAKQGKVVARLKGGDPFIFGRGGEEILELVNNHIDFEIIPGITAGIAAATYAGISLTQRGYTSTLAFITGHEDINKENSGIDWTKISTGIGTLVFYMGIKNLPVIVNKLIVNGRDKNTPVALIRWGTYNYQETLVGTLENIVQKVEETSFTPPSIIIVGEVIELREKLRWFDNKPLFNKKIIVTRNRNQSSTLSKSLKELGANVIEFPTIQIQPVSDYAEIDNAIHQLDTFSWIIFPSVNSAEIFFNRLYKSDYDARHLKNTKVVAIGSETGNKLTGYGIIADLLPDTFTSEGIVNAFKSINNNYTGERILLPSSEIARDIISNELAKLGAEIINIPIYKNVLPDYSKEYVESVFTDDVSLITFTSSSTVTNLVDILKKHKKEDYINKINGVSIGPVTSQTAKALGVNIIAEASIHTIQGLVDAISGNFSK